MGPRPESPPLSFPPPPPAPLFAPSPSLHGRDNNILVNSGNIIAFSLLERRGGPLKPRSSLSFPVSVVKVAEEIAVHTYCAMHAVQYHNGSGIVLLMCIF